MEGKLHDPGNHTAAALRAGRRRGAETGRGGRREQHRHGSDRPDHDRVRPSGTGHGGACPVHGDAGPRASGPGVVGK